MSYDFQRTARHLYLISKVAARFTVPSIAKALAALVVVKLMASYLASGEFGQLGQLTTTVGILASFAGGGFINALIPLLSRPTDQRDRQAVLTTALVLFLLQALVTSVLIILFRDKLSQFLLARDDLGWIFVIVGLSQWIIGAGNLVQAALSVEEKTGTIALLNAFGTIASTPLIILLIINFGFVGAAVGISLTPVISSIVVFVGGILRLPPDWRVLVPSMGTSHFLALLSYVPVTVVSFGALPLAQIIVRQIVGTRVGWDCVGYWQVVLRLSDVYMQFVGMMVVFYALPRFSRWKNRNQLDNEFKSIRLGIMSLMVAAFVVIYFSRDIILELLFSPAYAPAGGYFLPNLVGDTFRLLSMFYVYYAISRGARLVPILFELLQAIGLVGFTYVILTWSGDGRAPVFAHLLTHLTSFLFLFALHQRKAVVAARRPAAAGDAKATDQWIDPIPP